MSKAMLAAGALLGVVVLAVVGLFVWHPTNATPAPHATSAPSAPPATNAPAAMSAAPATTTLPIDRRCLSVIREAVDRQAARPVTQGGPVAVVLGDSWASGSYLPAPRVQAWSTLIGEREQWTTYVYAVGGTGFVNAGACGGETYEDRVPAVLALHPAVVLIEGGLNDDSVPAARETRAERALLGRLASVPTVIVVGPARVPVRLHTSVIDRALAAGAAADHRRYISTQRWRLPLLSDRLHLTADSQPIFARYLAAAIG